MDRKLQVSVVLPTLYRDPFLKRVLHDLLKQEGLAAWEIVVIDQNAVPVAERDGELHRLGAIGLVRWVECVGKGVVYAHNLGIALARGDIVVFIDDDVKIDDSRFLERHWRTHETSAPDVAAVCGREVNPGGAEFVRVIDYRRTSPMEDILHFPRNYCQPTAAVVLSTANCSVKKGPLLKVEGFDERFRGASYGDDGDLALRLVQRGYQILYDPGPALVHLHAPFGGMRLTGTNPHMHFSQCDRIVSAVVFYHKHIRGQYPQYRWFYIYHYILRKSVLLKVNLQRPWRLPAVVIGLCQAVGEARRLIHGGHQCSFRAEYLGQLKEWNASVSANSR
ncbi:MAG TPA: glycosyltransferase [Verrucomicrobiae bacterium]|nr:glycosyltransferase [Verrucomicrobiae bacterium]